MSHTDATKTPDPIDLHVGARLRARRRDAGVSQEDLAGALSITFQQVQKYERGKNRISASKLFEASRFLGVRPGWFFEGLDWSAAAGAALEVDPVALMATAPYGPAICVAFLQLAEIDRATLVNLARRMAAGADLAAA